MMILKKNIWVPSLSGLLYGYNTGIIAGAILFLTGFFSLSHFEQGIVVGIGFLGTCLACFSGILANYWGRKRLLIASCFLTIVGCLCSAFAMHLFVLLVGRFMVCAASGMAIIVAPIYLVEVAPTEIRGSVLTLNQVGNASGTLLSYVCSYFLASKGDWRLMFGLGLLPAVIQLIGFCFIPDSCSREVRREKIAHSSWKKLMTPEFRLRFKFAFSLALFQVLAGSTAVFYFAPRVFEHISGHNPERALLATVYIGIVYFIGILFSFWTVDRWGRRPLLFTSFAGMAASYLTISLCGFFGAPFLDSITLVCLTTYIAFYAIGIGPIPALIVGEISPLPLRGHLMSLMGVTVWALSYCVAISFLPLVHLLGLLTVFGIFAFFCLLALSIFYRVLPETKQKSLQEIDRLFKKGRRE